MINLAIKVSLELIARFEGCVLTPYLCPAGVPTIGYGSTRYLDGTAVQLTDKPITKAYARHLLLMSVYTEYLPGVIKLCPGITEPEQMAAIIDFTYNLGVSRLKASTLRKRINDDLWGEVPTELRKWVWAGGRRLRGLERRREAEIELLELAD